jgi:hypothetical protein
MICDLCGHENRDTAKFCDTCGGALDRTVTRTGIDPEMDAVRKAFDERFVVESLLGRGGMGNVYKARDRALDRYVAIKIVPEFRSKDEQFIERFRREARIAARLRHPRIVSVHEVGTMGPFPYFSMDYIEGNTLRSVVERNDEEASAFVVFRGRHLPLREGVNVLGRDGTADVLIDDSTVSRKHATIAIGPRAATLEDLASKNGTFVDGVRLEAPVELRDGDTFVLGDASVRFRKSATGSTVTAATQRARSRPRHR